LVKLHNSACKDKVYASSLISKIQELIQEGKLEPFDDMRMLVLSLDWPIAFEVSKIVSEAGFDSIQ
jgi:hypothetical protein